MKTVIINNHKFVVPEISSTLEDIKKRLLDIHKQVYYASNIDDEKYSKLYKSIINVLCAAADISQTSRLDPRGSKPAVR